MELVRLVGSVKDKKGTEEFLRERCILKEINECPCVGSFELGEDSELYRVSNRLFPIYLKN